MHLLNIRLQHALGTTLYLDICVEHQFLFLWKNSTEFPLKIKTSLIPYTKHKTQDSDNEEDSTTQNSDRCISVANIKKKVACVTTYFLLE